MKFSKFKLRPTHLLILLFIILALRTCSCNKGIEGLSHPPEDEEDERVFSSYGSETGLYNTDEFGESPSYGDDSTEKHVYNSQGGYGDINNGYGKDSYDESGYEGGEGQEEAEAESKSQFTGAIKVIAGLGIVILALTFFRPSGLKSRILQNTPIKMK